MNATTPETTRLATRLRQLADEIESAARYGVPTPYNATVSGHEYGGASFSATSEEFDAWAEYTEASVEEYDSNDRHWRSAEVDVNGLSLRFACSTPITEAVTVR
jgi:hypothetical protein